MGFMLRQIAPSANLVEELSLDVFAATVSLPVVQAIVSQHGVATRRHRKLPAELALLLVVAMNLFTHDALDQVLRKLLQGLRLLWPDPGFLPATKSAICQARYHLGVAPVADLFHQVCRPMATPATPGAFLFGLRLMALDGTTEDVPDTPQNARAFGRPSTDRGEGAFPQVQGVYLVECGTHALVDGGFWPCHTSERVGALRLLRSVTPDMLVMWDRGLHSFEMARQTRDRGAQFLGRVPSKVKLTPLDRLPDGSFLAYLRPGDRQRRKTGERLLVRVITYTLTDPALPGYGETYRLITSLLDPEWAPARELAAAYHERWEIEITLDEIDTHQRLAHHPLRSQKPIGVLQELYGLLIAHYVVRRVMLDAAAEAGVDPDRISFLNAVRLICQAIPEFQLVAREERPRLYQRLVREIGRYRLPERKPRSNPRVVKRKMSNFPLKRAKHHHWPQPSRPFREAIAILN